MNLFASHFLGIALAASGAGAHSPSTAAQVHIDRFVDSYQALRAKPHGRAENIAANRAMMLLLTDKSRASDEALAALSGHYMGESQEPECEVLARGKRMVPLLEQFDRHPPAIRLKVDATHSRSVLISQIRSGIVCE